MCFLLHLTLFLCANAIKAGDVKDEPTEALNLTVYDISDRLLTLFGVHHDKERIKDLKEKLERINHYVVDHNLVADVLTNVTMETKLNETNFYQALNESDHLRYLNLNESKNLYLKLKEKMNRDDIMKIVAEKDKRSKLVKSARRKMGDKLPEHGNDENINDVVDKLLAETPNDQHKVKTNESLFWDPQGELEEMKSYHENKKSGRRIFRGERTTIRHYPFMASVQLMGRFWCGAVLISSDMCITSASCLQLIHNNRFFRENPRILQVRIGSNHSRAGGELIDVLEVYFHPGYNPKTLKCNLAVVRLRRHLFFSRNTMIKYLSISYNGNSLPTTDVVLLLGWGVTKISQKMPYEPIFLQKKVLPVYPNTFCKEVYGDKFISDTMFCAGTLSTGEGACDHDAGGPAILFGRLVGIISFGPSTCGFNAPTVFTNVGAFSDWIETVMESMPEYYIGQARTTTTTESQLEQFLATYDVTNGGSTKPQLIDPITTSPSEESEENESPLTITEPVPTTTTRKVTTKTTTTPRPVTNATSPVTPASRVMLKYGFDSDESSSFYDSS